MGELFIHDLNEYVNGYGCSTFIETGTGCGTGLDYALKYPFKKLFSIEYMEQLYNDCEKKFDDDRLELLNTDSLTGLNKILNQLNDEPVLFWLDAHFPGADFHFNSYDHLSENPSLHKPLREELALIKSKRPNNNDVIIIDDLQLYELGDFELLWDEEFKNKYCELESGIGFIEDLFSESHTFVRNYRHQGSLFLVPKFCKDDDQVCLIRQPGGLGDILFSQKIAETWVCGGYDVIWPVEDKYYNDVMQLKSGVDFCPISEWLKSVENISQTRLFTADYKQPIKRDNFTYIPLSHGYEYFSGGKSYEGILPTYMNTNIHPIMQAKYNLVRLLCDNWAEYFNFVRNKEREDYLFYEILGLMDNGPPFALINRNFASDLITQEIFKVPVEMPIVEMNIISDITIFDWCKVIEKAHEIHTVDTALSFVIEKIPWVTDRLYVYKRTGYQSYDDLVRNTNMFNKSWTACGE